MSGQAPPAFEELRCVPSEDNAWRRADDNFAQVEVGMKERKGALSCGLEEARSGFMLAMINFPRGSALPFL